MQHADLLDDTGRGAGHQAHSGAALLIARGVINNQPNSEAGGRLIHHLAPQKQAIAVVVGAIVVGVLQESVTLVPHAVQSR